MKIKAMYLAALVVILAGCKSNQSEQDNIDKLLDQQAQIQERQESAVSDLAKLKDSLASEKTDLLEEKESKEGEIRRLETDRALLVKEFNKADSADLSTQKAALESQIKTYRDSIDLLKSEMELLNASLDSLNKNLSVYSVQETRTMERLESGVEEIDRRMKNRESRKNQEIKRVGLLERRIEVAEKKIEAYRMEKQLYVDERDELLRANADEDKLAPFEARIAAMDSTIRAEEKARKALADEKDQAQQFIAETDRVMEELNRQIREEYDRQEIIESFIASEKERLQQELQDVRQARQALLEEQASIATQMEELDVRVTGLDQDMDLISNREMGEILDRQASIEYTEAELAREEVSMLDEYMGTEYMPYTPLSDSLGEEMKSLLRMGDELDSLNALIQAEKAQIAGTREQLSEQRARVAEQRAKIGKAAGITVLVIILAGAGLLALFYALGRRARKRK